MKLSTKVDATAVAIVADHDNIIEQVAQAAAGLLLCETLWAGGHFSRLSDTQLVVENGLGRKMYFNTTAESLDDVLAVFPTVALPSYEVAARGMMTIFGVEDEQDIALGLSLCQTALKLCLLANSSHLSIGFRGVVEALKRKAA